MKNKYFYAATLLATIGLFAFTVSASPSLFFANNNVNQLAAVSVTDSNTNNLANNSDQLNFSMMSGFSTDITNSMKADGRGGVGLMDASKKAQIINKAKIRKIAAKALLKNNPLLFLSNTIPASTKTLLPIEAQNEIETRKTFTGVVDVMVIDDFKNPQNSRNEYYLTTDSGKYNLYPTSDLNMVSGTKIQAEGYFLDNDIVVDTNNDNVKVLESRAKLLYANKTFSSVGNQRTLVLLIKSYSTDKEPFTPTQAKDLVFNGQFQKFMQEQSYGKVSFSGDVFGWYTIGRALSCYGGNNGSMPTDSELGKMVTQYGIDLQDYDRVVYLSTASGFTFGACSGVGKTNYVINGSKYSFSQLIVEGLSSYDQPSFWGVQPFGWTNLDYTLSHEMGHSLGVVHANGWACSNYQILYGDCQHIEYGNPYDVMGNLSYSLDYNAYFKEQLGWIPPSQVLSVTQSGSYVINPLEIQSGVKLIKVNIPNTRIAPFFVEFRKAIGFDSNLNELNYSENQKGIFVNHIQDEWAPATEILDMSPGQNQNYWSTYIKQATLNYISTSSPMRSFVDEGRGITIGPVLDVSTSSITFNVDLKQPSCSRFSPSINYSYPSYVSAGSSGYIDIMIKNKDYYGCEPSVFDVSFVSPQWKVTEYPEEDLVLVSEKFGYKTLQYYVPVGTAPGIYTVAFDVSNKSTGLRVTKSIQITVTEPLAIKEINPVFGPVGTMVSITGTGFNNEKNQVNVTMCGTGCSINQILTGVNGKIVYTIPSEIQVCDPVNGCHNIPTPNGDYKIYISTNSASVNADFHVGSPVIKPTVSLADKKVLSLQYDSLGGESVLTSIFNVNITAGSEDQKIAKEDAFSTYIKTESNLISVGPIKYAQPLGTIDDGNGYYIISAGSSITFEVKTTFYPKKMFAGAYYGVISQVILGDKTRSIKITFPEPNTTNRVTIIGELSPYLDLISPNPTDSDTMVTILGTRLPTSGNVVNLINKSTKIKTIVSASGSITSLQFKPTVLAGEYIVSVTHPTTGDSNNLNLIVTAPPAVSPSVSLADKKVLSLKYNSTGGESELVSTFNVMISPGSEDQKILKSGAFASYVTKVEDGMNMWGEITYPQPLGTIDDGNGYYIVSSKNATTTFTVTATFNPKIMFAGTYSGVMGYVRFGQGRWVEILPPNTTNRVTIIGELSPYIDYISSPKEGVASDATVTISGVRFPSKGNVVNLVNVSTGQKTTVFAIGSGNGTKLQFKPSVVSGQYIVSVAHPVTGDSNGWGLTVISSATPFSPALFRSSSGASEPIMKVAPLPAQPSVSAPIVTPPSQPVPSSSPSAQPTQQPAPSSADSQTSNIFDAFGKILKTIFVY